MQDVSHTVIERSIVRGAIKIDVPKIFFYSGINNLSRHETGRSLSEGAKKEVRIKITGDTLYRTSFMVLFEFGDEGKWVMIDVSPLSKEVHIFEDEGVAFRVLKGALRDNQDDQDLSELVQMMKEDSLNTPLLK